CLLSNAPLQDTPDGAQLYKKNCKVCHGKDASKETKKIPSLMLSEVDADGMREMIINGKETMPAFGEQLKEGEIEAVISYVQSLQAAGQEGE
ncbi:MAG: cytochrome c, partial [Bacteroidota bacterium]